MARYRPIILEGLLMQEGRQLILQITNGGQWRLVALGRQEHLLGRQVRVEGVREDHDIVAVDKITAR
jgi:hypothetical protein